jgi:1-acyl-sn-glycerol-3-phosphate acyltransferase
MWQVDVHGLDRLPARGPFVLAANHRSFFDSVFLATVVARPISFLAKAEYFDQRRTAWLFRSLDQIPVRRGNGRAAVEALAAARSVLDRGGIVGIYPEGTRSRDGRLYRGNSGVARLPRSAGVPIVPVGLIGTAAVQAPGSRVPRPFRPVTVRIGFPQDPPPIKAPLGSKALLREETGRLMHAIANLCDQPYVDAYAPQPV